MYCEVEFLPVGNKSSAGDAIVVRYGTPQAFELMLIDGGLLETGDEIVVHLRTRFGADVRLTHVLLTHCDGDHASGLRTVFSEVPVSNFWVNLPWFAAVRGKHLFKSKSWTDDGIVRAIESEYPIISELVELASAQGSNINPAMQGKQIGPFVVLSPNLDAYVNLVAQFDRTPEPDRTLIESRGYWMGKEPQGLAGIFQRLGEAARNWIAEAWDVELLRDGGVTSASNESSVVLYANLDGGQRILLTGDAGVRALTWAADYAQACGYPLGAFTLVQVPHHGSRRNVGPTILDRLLGPKRHLKTPEYTAIVSAPKDDEKHPRKIVLNAFMRRGAKVLATQGTSIVHYGGFPARSDYVPAMALPFSTTVEDYD